MSNQIDFVKNSAEVLASAKNAVKTTGVTVQGELVKLKACGNAKVLEILEKMSEDERTQFVTSLGWTDDYTAPTPSADEVLVSMEGEEKIQVETKAGTSVEAVNLEYVGTSGNGNFKFAMANGNIVTHSGDKLRRLHSAGGLNIGDKIPFKPESIKPTTNVGYFQGVPNFSGSDRLAQMEQFSADNKLAIKARKAELRDLEVPESRITDIIIAEFGGAESSVVVKPKRPTFS